jgi:AcrR family transcriptional regulator
MGPVSPPTNPQDGSGLRVDAERNRARVVAVAREVFAEQGLGVPMTEIARRAGVGIATLYRRFPTPEDLIVATFAEKMTAYADAIDTALADPDPWRGFCAYVERVCAMQADDRGFTRVLTTTFPQAKAFEAERDRAYRGLGELILSAQRAGRLRGDFSPEDLVLFLMANAGVVEATGDAAPDAWRRLVAYLLQACAGEAARPLPDPPTPRQMYRALLPRPATPSERSRPNESENGPWP